MNRRNFMKMCAVAAVGAVLPLPAVAAGAPSIAPVPIDFAAYLSMRHRVAMLHIAEMMEEAFFAPAITKIAYKGDEIGWVPVWMDICYKEKP